MYHYLKAEEFCTLEGQRYVNGSVIDSYMISKCAKWSKKGIKFLPTSLTHYILGDHSNYIKPPGWIGYNLNFQFKGIYFLPYTLGKHWCLLVINVDQKTI